MISFAENGIYKDFSFQDFKISTEISARARGTRLVVNPSFLVPGKQAYGFFVSGVPVC